MIRDWKPQSPGQPIVLGHRGTRSTSVENTMPSFEAAVREGAAGIEFDVRLDANERVVVHHDASLRRLTEGADTRLVEQLKSSELDAVRLWNGERIPTVLDVLDWANRQGVLLNIELKASLRKPAILVVNLLNAIRSAETKVPILLSSFDPRIVARLSQLAPHYTLGWLIEESTYTEARVDAWRRLKANAVCSEWPLLTAERAMRWRSDQALLVAWTVNAPGVALELAGQAVGVLISDTPAAIVAALAVARRSP